MATPINWKGSPVRKTAKPGPSLQFTEQSVPLGEVNITGQFIRRLVLTGGPYLVILDQPAGVVKIPTGNYNQPDILLEQNGAAGLLQLPASRKSAGGFPWTARPRWS